MKNELNAEGDDSEVGVAARVLLSSLHSQREFFVLFVSELVSSLFKPFGSSSYISLIFYLPVVFKKDDLRH